MARVDELKGSDYAEQWQGPLFDRVETCRRRLESLGDLGGFWHSGLKRVRFSRQGGSMATTIFAILRFGLKDSPRNTMKRSKR